MSTYCEITKNWNFNVVDCEIGFNEPIRIYSDNKHVRAYLSLTQKELDFLLESLHFVGDFNDNGIRIIKSAVYDDNSSAWISTKNQRTGEPIKELVVKIAIINNDKLKAEEFAEALIKAIYNCDYVNKNHNYNKKYIKYYENYDDECVESFMDINSWGDNND